MFCVLNDSFLGDFFNSEKGQTYEGVCKTIVYTLHLLYKFLHLKNVLKSDKPLKQLYKTKFLFFITLVSIELLLTLTFVYSITFKLFRWHSLYWLIKKCFGIDI